MVVLIDPPQWPAHGRLWSHLISDHSLAELHAFARDAGVPERGFEGDHYDVPEEQYDALIASGAHPVSTRELLARLQRSGLRRPKRRGERVLVSIETKQGRQDVVGSLLDPPRAVASSTLVVRSGRAVLVDSAARALPRLTGPTRDLEAAATFATAVLGPAAASLAWRRVGYVRWTVPAAAEAVERPAPSYESVLTADLAREGDDSPGGPVAGPTSDAGSAGADPSAGWCWQPVEDVILGQSQAVAPLIRLLYGAA